MSCRVLNRGVETLTLCLLVKQAKEWGCESLIGEYIPSLKNEMVSQHYLKMGFHQISDHTYELNLSESIKCPTTITLKETP